MQQVVSTGDTDVRRAGEAGMIGAIARWCECLHGLAPLIEALEQIAESLDADAVGLSRTARNPGGKFTILTFDKSRSRSSSDRLDRSFARSILGVFFDKPKTGSVWVKSMVEVDPDPSLIEFHRRRKMYELVVIPLSVTDKSIDCLELHFADRLTSTQNAIFNMLADTLTQTWANRAPGLFTESMLRLEGSKSRPQPNAPILSDENPARLSRAEYRVCLLLSRGKSVKRVQSELAICQSTVRTHLRNIYAKTNTSGQAELMYLLLSAAPVSGGYAPIDNVA